MGWSRRLAVALVLAVSSLASSTAHAQDREPREHWRWQRFMPEEVIALVLGQATGHIVTFAQPDVGTRWTSTLPLDEELRDVLRLRTPEGRRLAASISDTVFFVMTAWPITIDAFVLAGLVHQDWDAMAQMALIDAEVLSIAYGISALTTRFAGRQRPSARECNGDPNGERDCGDEGVGPHASFVSGHTLVVLASAGLVCSHHLNNPWLTGSSAGATLMCGGSLGLAGVVAAYRMMTDLHWATDILAGAAIGGVLGFLLPWALHYAHPVRRGARSEAPSFTFRVTPQLDPSQQSLFVSGSF
ncbi:phosphatase PAP2 family protein [Sandaracinus amylolyticus]|uniref:phosphatase PAP2 family protein n=1 Tax=Sandaracinus amylolyticus TaxID=927083 RepID=UPI001F270D92|nr:phosphatase PAP2 family protein [Sandaracinus amylolyticus]UJR84659.1 Hypothetical protein I5071_67380 [Sandaracinus amylolyticus]